MFDAQNRAGSSHWLSLLNPQVGDTVPRCTDTLEVTATIPRALRGWTMSWWKPTDI